MNRRLRAVIFSLGLAASSVSLEAAIEDVPSPAVEGAVISAAVPPAPIGKLPPCSLGDLSPYNPWFIMNNIAVTGAPGAAVFSLAHKALLPSDIIPSVDPRVPLFMKSRLRPAPLAKPKARQSLRRAARRGSRATKSSPVFDGAARPADSALEALEDFVTRHDDLPGPPRKGAPPSKEHQYTLRLIQKTSLPEAEWPPMSRRLTELLRGARDVPESSGALLALLEKYAAANGALPSGDGGFFASLLRRLWSGLIYEREETWPAMTPGLLTLLRTERDRLFAGGLEAIDAHFQKHRRLGGGDFSLEVLAGYLNDIMQRPKPARPPMSPALEAFLQAERDKGGLR